MPAGVENHLQPSSSSMSSSTHTTPSSLMPKLLEACKRHGIRHDRERRAAVGNQNENDVATLNNDWCDDELSSFARVLPRLEGAVLPRDSTFVDGYALGRRRRLGAVTGGDDDDPGMRDDDDPGMRDDDDDDDDNDSGRHDEDDDVDRVCALYRAISSGSFCPNASRRVLFVDPPSLADDVGWTTTTGGRRDDGVKDDDDNDDECGVGIVVGVLPRVTALLNHVSMDPERLLERSPPSSRRHDSRVVVDEENAGSSVIGTTISHLLSISRKYQYRVMACIDLLRLSDLLGNLDYDDALFDPPSAITEGEVVVDHGDVHREGGERVTRRGLYESKDAHDATTSSTTNDESSERRRWPLPRRQRTPLGTSAHA
jgi:hypothetical protein